MDTQLNKWRLRNPYHASEAHLQEQQVQPETPARFYTQSERNTAEASTRTPAPVSDHLYTRSLLSQDILDNAGPQNVADGLQSSSELLSDEELEIPVLDTLDHPPPFTRIAYDPLPRPMSTDTLSVTDAVPRDGYYTLSGHSIAHLPPHLHRVRRPPVAAPVPSAVRLGPQTQSTTEESETQTDSSDIEVSRKLRQMQIKRLLATDRAFDSGPPLPESLALPNSQIDSRRQPQRLIHGKDNATVIASAQQAGPQHRVSWEDSNRHPPRLPADSRSQEYQNRHHRGNRVHKDQPVIQRTPQQSEPPQQETIIVQVPEETFSPALELIEDQRLRQQAILEQYRGAARYLRDLNQWFEDENQGRRDDFRRLNMRLSRLQDDVQRMGI